MNNENFSQIIQGIKKNYEAKEISFNRPNAHFPSRKEVLFVIDDLRHVMFPTYFNEKITMGENPEYFIGNTLIRMRKRLIRQIGEAYKFRDLGEKTEAEIDAHTEEVVDRFMNKLPEIQRVLLTDVQAAFDGDPAAQSKEEIIFSYPGFLAIFVYRFAHELYVENVPLIPRIMSEWAHARSGVDINSGATIDEYFFIDHATGVVIGETTNIGKHVKIYQGVTLGALSTRAGQALAGVKRHPTIKDNVTVYSNASVLGGETVVGEDTVIAGGAFVTESIPPHSRVTVTGTEVSVRQAKRKPESWEI